MPFQNKSQRDFISRFVESKYEREENKMRKGLVLFLIVTLIVSISIIGFSYKGKVLGGIALAAEKTSEERYVFVSIVSAHPFWIDAKEGGRDAAEQLGVTFEYTGPAELDFAAQATTFEQIMATKPAGLITTGHNPDAMIPVINKAIDKGIPVFTVDTDAPRSKRLTYIGTNNYNAGIFMGKLVESILGGEGSIGISTQPGQFNLEERIRGLEDYLAENTNIKIVATSDNKSDDSVAADATAAMILSHPEINLVTSMNATGAGVAAALRQTGKVGKVHAVVFDVTEPILNGVKDGTLDATIAQRTYLFTYLAVKLMYDYNHGKLNNMVGVAQGVIPLPNIIDTGVIAVTKDNVDAFFRK